MRVLVWHDGSSLHGDALRPLSEELGVHVASIAHDARWRSGSPADFDVLLVRALHRLAGAGHSQPRAAAQDSLRLWSSSQVPESLPPGGHPKARRSAEQGDKEKRGPRCLTPAVSNINAKHASQLRTLLFRPCRVLFAQGVAAGVDALRSKQAGGALPRDKLQVLLRRTDCG